MVEYGVTGNSDARSLLRAGPIVVAIVALWSNCVMAVERGGVAPGFSLPVIANASHSQRDAAKRAQTHFPVLHLEDYRGRVVYLDFWASFCLPCRESLPLLSALRDEFSRNDVEFIAVTTDSNPKDALAFLTNHPVSYPVVSDPAALTYEAYGSTALPTAYLIARDGTIRAKHQGFRSKDIAEIRSALAALSASAVSYQDQPSRLDKLDPAYDEKRGYK
jgi:thiol-disulfide isomerase/thioredoxin